MHLGVKFLQARDYNTFKTIYNIVMASVMVYVIIAK